MRPWVYHDDFWFLPTKPKWEKEVENIMTVAWGIIFGPGWDPEWKPKSLKIVSKKQTVF